MRAIGQASGEDGTHVRSATAAAGGAVADAGAEDGVVAHAAIAAANVITSNSRASMSAPSSNLPTLILTLIYTLRLPRAGVRSQGLTRCTTCRWFTGDYLALSGEGDGDLTPRVIHVHCRCENHNRCAGCGQTLADWRLSAYHYDEAGRSVRYVAAYSAFSHCCR